MPRSPVKTGVSVGCMRAQWWGIGVFLADPKGAATRNQISGACKLKRVSAGARCTAAHPKRPYRQRDGAVRSIPSAGAGDGARRGACPLLPSGSFSTASRFTSQPWSSRAVLHVVTLQPLSRLLSSLVFQELNFTSPKVSAGLREPSTGCKGKTFPGKKTSFRSS